MKFDQYHKKLNVNNCLLLRWPALASLGEGANQFILHPGMKINCPLRPAPTRKQTGTNETQTYGVFYILNLSNITKT